MRLMASVASEAAGVIGRYDLGKGFRLCAVGFVAAGAEDQGVEFRGRHIGWIVRVLGLGTVANLAVEVGVGSEFLLIGNIRVAAFADFVTGKNCRPGGDFGDGGSAIVPVLAETLGDDRGAKDNEEEYRERHDGGETDEMFDVLKHGPFPAAHGRSSNAKLHSDLRYRGLKQGTMSRITGERDGTHDTALTQTAFGLQKVVDNQTSDFGNAFCDGR